jgi:hypothetical protein
MYYRTRRRLWKANTTITGPNDASRVVWALGEFFSISFVFFYYLMTYIGTTDALKVWRGSVGATTKITGPNDASRVVWAISECFFYFIVFFSY